MIGVLREPRHPSGVPTEELANISMPRSRIFLLENGRQQGLGVDLICVKTITHIHIGSTMYSLDDNMCK